MLDYLHLSPPPTQQPFKRQSGRQPRDEYYSEGEPSGDDDVQPPPRRRVRLSPPPLSAPSQASSRVVLGDIPLEDLPSSRRKTYSRRVRHIHRRQREEPAFSPVPRSQVPSFEELMEYQAAQERPPSYPSSGLSFLHSSQPRRIPGTYDDEYDEEDEWTAVLPRPGESARRVWRDRGEEVRRDFLGFTAYPTRTYQGLKACHLHGIGGRIVTICHSRGPSRRASTTSPRSVTILREVGWSSTTSLIAGHFLTSRTKSADRSTSPRQPITIGQRGRECGCDRSL